MNQIDSLVAALEPVTGMRQEPMGQPPKKPTAPSVTPADIEANISAEFFFTAADGARGRAVQIGGFVAPYCIRHNDDHAEPAAELLTFCVLVLRNGFTVTGESACVSPENFNAVTGREVARENAINKIWPLMGYALKERLAHPPCHAPLTDSDIEVIKAKGPGEVIG